MTTRLTPLPGGVCATPGIEAAGVAAGLKPSGGLDLALVAADRPVVAAAVQTRNQVRAHSVTLTERHLSNGRARAVLLNAGHANVCSGPEGLRIAEAAVALVAEGLACDPSDVLMCSTGLIGAAPPRATLLAGIPTVVEALSPDGGGHAAKAILTTDTVAKEYAVRVDDAGGACVIGGMAKGSGMIAPELATMLVVLTTDAPMQEPVLRATLRDVVSRTFGRISVDGCMSTNDAIVVLSTGTAAGMTSLAAFKEGLTAVCHDLALRVVRDGEGATRLVHIRVTGAATENDAVGVGRAIANSALVKTAIAGGDPNWGRVLGAMGAGPVRFNPDRVAVSFGGITVCRNGVVANFSHHSAAAALSGADVRLTIDLGSGGSEATFWTCDLTHGYITINAEYTT